MPLLELRGRLRYQTLHRRLSKREISLKNLLNARNATNKIARRIKNTRVRFVKEHIQISINKLRDRKQIIPELVHKIDIIRGKAVIYLDDTGTEYLTLLVIPQSHILLM
jgi:transposase